MIYIELYEAYSKRRMLLVEETSKIKKDLDDMFIELTDNGFKYELKSGVVGTSKLKDHTTETLYLVIAKPNDIGTEHPDIFNTTYFDSTLDTFKEDDIKEYVLMFIDYIRYLWTDIDVDVSGDEVKSNLFKKNKNIENKNVWFDKYYVRIKKRD
jgi:hypothetical protein